MPLMGNSVITVEPPNYGHHGIMLKCPQWGAVLYTEYSQIEEAQLNEVLSASNLDLSALTIVTRKLEVHT